MGAERKLLTELKKFKAKLRLSGTRGGKKVALSGVPIVEPEAEAVEDE